MSKELSALEQVLVTTIQKASTTTGEVYDATKGVTIKAVDFASQQIPDVIHQLLLWKMWENVVIWTVSLGVIWLFFRLNKWFLAREAAANLAKEYYDHVPHSMFMIFGGVSMVLGGATSAVIALLTIIKIIVAPKLYVLEYAAGLLK